MRRFPMMILSCLVLLLASCVKEEISGGEKPAGKQVTIRVSVPEDPYTKVALTAEGPRLHLAWQDTDCIRVISGEQSEVYTLSKKISDHEAEFTGTALSGTRFDILCPGTYASIAAAEGDTASPAQSGNGSTEHLKYKALLSGVDAYENIEFKASWASAHGGTLKQGAAVKLQATLPEGVRSLKKAGLRLGGKDYFLPLSEVDVADDEQVLTAYLMLPWEDIPLADGTTVPVYAMDEENEVYSAALPISGDKTLLSGRLNSIVGVTLALQDYVAGDGTEEAPYVIANTRQLKNMMDLYKDAEAPADKDVFKKWFCLMGDVDASSINPWRPLNYDGSFYKAIDFDGCGYTISGLETSGASYNYPSFAGVLYGTVKNVIFDGATITGSNRKCGVVAGYLGTDGLPGSCENVIVRNASVTSSGYTGGFAGQIRSTGHVTGCRVENTTLTTTSYAGGFAAYIDLGSGDKYEVPCIFTDCHVDNVTINQNYATAAEWYTGGFAGYAGQASSFIGCSVKATITANKAALKDIGGFMGRDTYAGSNFINCRVLEGSSVTAKGNHVGGFIGYSEVAATFTECSSAADVTNEAEFTGGFVGYASGASGFTGCSVAGDVSGIKHTGGFAGTAVDASFTDCSYEGGTVSDSFSGQAQSAGFCAYAKTGVSFRGCFVRGATLSFPSCQRVGGFIGQMGDNSTKGNTNITISQCYVENTTLTGTNNCGGFVGVQYDNISRCWVSGGTITAKGNNCGGFSGFTDTANLTNCYATATVVGGTYTAVGGMIGIQNKGDVTYCYAAGAVSGSSASVGAFVGNMAVAASHIDHCIGWQATLPFYGARHDSATLSDIYAGMEGTISSQAAALAWPEAIWILTGAQPTLQNTPRRIPAIYVGDSITWQWARNANTFAASKLKIPFNSAYMTQSGDNVTVAFHPGFFAGNGYIDKGISGQNTSQMLSRFQKDVIDLNPVVVVIMGGTNDLAQGVTKEQIVANITAMAQMATDAGIRVVLCSVTPNNDSYSKLSNPKTKGAHIITLNGMIQALVAEKGYTYCDYWSSLVDEDGLSLKEAYRLYDNLHPGPDGYDVMEPIIRPIIEGLL